jgi:hypothetical protein
MMPAVGALPKVAPGRQLLVLDTPGDPTRVARIAGEGTGLASDGSMVTTIVTKDVCVTPCVHDLRPGSYTLLFSSMSDPARSDALSIDLGQEPLVVRHLPAENRGQWGFPVALTLGLTNLAFIPMGAAFTATGAANHDDGFKYAGIALLATGVVTGVLAVVLGHEGRGTYQPSATTQWTLPATTERFEEPRPPRDGASGAPRE